MQNYFINKKWSSRSIFARSAVVGMTADISTIAVFDKTQAQETKLYGKPFEEQTFAHIEENTSGIWGIILTPQHLQLSAMNAFLICCCVLLLL
jgi:hypothetical protein